jgi:hypothetical protein
MTTMASSSALPPPTSRYGPREAMRLAKLELMRDEAREAERKFERRRSKRTSSIAKESQKSRSGKKSKSTLATELEVCVWFSVSVRHVLIGSGGDGDALISLDNTTPRYPPVILRSH